MFFFLFRWAYNFPCIACNRSNFVEKTKAIFQLKCVNAKDKNDLVCSTKFCSRIPCIRNAKTKWYCVKTAKWSHVVQTKPDIRMSSIRVKWILFLQMLLSFLFLHSRPVYFSSHRTGNFFFVLFSTLRTRKRCIASTLNKHHSRIITHVIRTTKMMYYMQQSKEIALHGINGIHRARCRSVQPNSREQSNCTYWLCSTWCYFSVVVVALFCFLCLASMLCRLVYTWTLSHNFFFVFYYFFFRCINAKIVSYFVSVSHKQTFIRIV